MRTVERLKSLKAWAERELCEGRLMKSPAPDMDVAKLTCRQPSCYLAWQPTRPDETGNLSIDPLNVCPGVLIMPKAAHAKYVNEKRFDRAGGVARPQELGQTLSVDILFSVYEPGIRLPGFAESAEAGSIDMTLFREGTEEGLFTLLNWMDDCMTRLLGQRVIPGTDLLVQEASVAYSMYSDQSYIVDKRPLYYGFVTVDFSCYAHEEPNQNLEDLLR